MKRALVLGCNGFIGGHLVKLLKAEGSIVHGVDIEQNGYSCSRVDKFTAGDLRDQQFTLRLLDASFDEIYQLAADMGGAGYVFTGLNDAQILTNSAQINLNVASACHRFSHRNVLFTSSACIYPKQNQEDNHNPNCIEASAIPADPDSAYGWEKLFSELLYLSHNRDYGSSHKIARLHNVYGPEGAWCGGREKAPAALCRKVALAENGGVVDVWGDGEQTRSFLFVDDCVEALRSLMRSNVLEPVNVGSEQLISINQLLYLISEISGKKVSARYIPGPQGVRGRVSNNTLIRSSLGWQPRIDLRMGLEKTYHWIESRLVSNSTNDCITQVVLK